MARPKLDAKSDTVRMHLALPSKLIQRIEKWRAKQSPIPNFSEAIRTLTDLGMNMPESKKRERKRS